MQFKISYGKRLPFCLGLNVLKIMHVSKRGPIWFPVLSGGTVTGKKSFENQKITIFSKLYIPVSDLGIVGRDAIMLPLHATPNVTCSIAITGIHVLPTFNSQALNHGKNP